MYGSNLPDGLGHGGRRGNKGDQLTGRHGAADFRRQHNPDQGGNREGHKYLHNRGSNRLGGCHFQPLLHGAVGDVGKTLSLVLLTAKGAHNPITGYGLRRDMGYIPMELWIRRLILRKRLLA